MAEESGHYAKTRASDQAYQVFFNGQLILESSRVVLLDEHYNGKDFPAVVYFPKADIDSLETTDSDLSTYCPIKGDASYRNYQDIDNGIWCYREPVEAVSQIKNHFAFDQGKGFQVIARD